MAFYGVALNDAIHELNFRFRLALKKKGCFGVHALAKAFHDADVNNNNKLEFNEFKSALESFGVFPSIVELQAMMKYYDTDKDGTISYEEFLKGIREPMNKRRQDFVEKVYAMIDKNGSGSITLQDLANFYHPETSPDYISGQKTKEQVLQNFLNNFDSAKKGKDGVVTKQEFMDYYIDLSMGLPSDDYFASVLESTWKVVEENKPKEVVILENKSIVSQEEINDVSGALIAKLRVVAAPLNDEMIEKTYREFHKNKLGGMTMEEVQFMFKRFEILVDKKCIAAIVRKYDLNKSGALELDEFREYIKTLMETY